MFIGIIIWCYYCLQNCDQIIWQSYSIAINKQAVFTLQNHDWVYWTRSGLFTKSNPTESCRSPSGRQSVALFQRFGVLFNVVPFVILLEQIAVWLLAGQRTNQISVLVDHLVHLVIGSNGLFYRHRLDQYPVAHSTAAIHIAHHQFVVFSKMHVQHLIELHSGYVHSDDVIDCIRAALGHEEAHIDWRPVGSRDRSIRMFMLVW